MIDTGLVSLEIIGKKGRVKSEADSVDKNATSNEIRLSCDILNFYTCSDSLQVLTEVIQYLASAGDCPPQHSSEKADPENQSLGSDDANTSIGQSSKLAEAPRGGSRLGDYGNEASVHLNAMIQEAIAEDLCASEFHRFIKSSICSTINIHSR